MYLEKFKPMEMNKHGDCLVCANDGYCQDYIQGLSEDTDVPAEWIAQKIVEGKLPAESSDASLDQVLDLWISELEN